MEKIKRLKRKIKLFLFLKVSERKLPQFLIFLLFPNFMGPEIRATLSGILEYNYNNSKLNEYKLRRNIHRIEKGLCSPKRRNIFALAYIEETVNELIKYNSKYGIDKKGSYYLGVLKSYFNVVDDSHETIKKSFTILKQSKLDEVDTGVFEKKLLQPQKIKKEFCDHYKNLIESRRSVRFYQDKEVPEELILEAVRASNQTPSACNRLPYEFLIFNETSKIVELLKYADGFQGDPSLVPCLVVLIGDLSAYVSEADRHLIYIDSSYGVMNFLLSLHSNSLGACMLNYAENDKYDNELRKILNLEKYKRVINLMTFGYPDYSVSVPYSEKKMQNFRMNIPINKL